MTHVTINRPIDWSQWNLDRSIRSIRMQVDRDNDMYALPVVVIDPTGDQVRTDTPIRTDWEWYATAVSAIITDVHTPAAGYTSFLDQYEICWAGDTLGAAAVNYILFEDPDIGIPHAVAWWCDVNPAYKVPYNCTLKFPLEFPTRMRVQLFAALTSGSVSVHIWGHDEPVVNQ